MCAHERTSAERATRRRLRYTTLHPGRVVATWVLRNNRLEAPWANHIDDCVDRHVARAPLGRKGGARHSDGTWRGAVVVRLLLSAARRLLRTAPAARSDGHRGRRAQ